MERTVLLAMLALAACGLPEDIVGPVDTGAVEAAGENCPTPAPDAHIDRPPC